MSVSVESALFEREAELDQLHSCLEHARAGTGQLVVVEGEAGIGKTALVRAACGAASRVGMLVLTARGTELERDFPFALVRQLFEPVLAAAEPGQRAELLAGAARLAGPLVGCEDSDDPGGAGSAGFVDPTFATLNALFWLTSNLAEAQATLLAVDDAHWADPASLRFLEFLLPRLEDLPVAFVVAARPGEPGASSEPLARLGTDASARTLRLRTLSATAVADLVRGALGPDASDTFCAACHEATRGNPFMLRELLGELRTEGTAGAAEDVGLVREMAPSSITRAVLLRLARLPEPARRLAAAVAVVGEECELRLAAAVADIDPVHDAGGAADALVAAGILEAGPRLRFVHPLVRNAIHADLGGSEQASAHARAARLLAKHGAEPERVAVHLLATEPAGDATVVQTLRAAAGRALARAAPEAAIRYLNRAVAEPPPPSERTRVLREAFIAGARTGNRAKAEELGIDPVAELSANEDDLLASAWPLTMWLLAWGRTDEARELLGRAAGLALKRGDKERALQLEAFLASSQLVMPAQARAKLAPYATIIQPDTKSERLWFALQSWWSMFLGDPALQAAEFARRALANGRIFAEQPDSAPPGQAILVLTRTEQLDLASDRTEALAAEARSRGSAFALAQASYLRANIQRLRGEVVQAEAEARSAVEAARRGAFLVAVPFYLAAYVDVLIDRDELEVANDELVQGGWNGPLPQNIWWAALLMSRARLRMAQRRFDEAITDLREFQRTSAKAGLSYGYYSVGSHLALALALGGCGDREEAVHSAERELERAQAWGTPSAIGAALRVLGLLETGERSLTLLREAVSVLEPSPVRLEYLRALTDYGAALRRANHRHGARAPLREALALARHGGALAIARQAHAELAATGEKLRPLLAEGVESLTASERRTAELAAEGLSNREIAQTLFLTIKTVEMHLSHAYRKLDIGSRRELPAALAQ